MSKRGESMGSGFDSVHEHTEFSDIELTGSPRWWTVVKNGETREVVRLDFVGTPAEQGLKASGVDPVIWISVPKGAIEFPVLVCSYFLSGDAGMAELREMGAELWQGDSPMGKVLSFVLLGVLPEEEEAV